MRVLLLNLLVLCTLLVALNAAAVVTYKLWRLAQSFQVDARAELPNYAAAPWARLHFRELQRMPQDYLSYAGWRRQAFKGETINIDAVGRRQTIPAQTPGGSVYVFGGSTVWGTGMRDGDTVPSQLGVMFPDRTFVNWAESGYTAHQSLEVLMELDAGGTQPDVVLFVDGVNDIGVKCLRGHTWNSRDGEKDIAWKIDNGNVLRFSQLIQPLIVFARKIAERLALGSEASYDCDVNPEKAAAVATAMVADWRMARMLAESWGGRFRAFLQPVAYLSETRTDHLTLDERLGEQYRAVYPRLRALLAAEPDFVDLTTAFDRDEYVYIDFCHFSPAGGRLLAEAMAPSLPSPN